jgi:hypothetical protein
MFQRERLFNDSFSEIICKKLKIAAYGAENTAWVRGIKLF